MAFTFFFRDKQTLEKAVIETIKTMCGREKIKIWDAGCAMGPEPYTLAIMFAEKMGVFAFKRVHIDATDLDQESEDFGNIINNGVYRINQLKRIPKELFEKYFRKNNHSDSNYVVEKIISDRVHFKKHDLRLLNPINNGYSLIVCKNVLLHLTNEQRIQVIKMYYDVLLPGGIYAMEQTQKMPKEVEHLFERISTGDKLFKKKLI